MLSIYTSENIILLFFMYTSIPVFVPFVNLLRARINLHLLVFTHCYK